MKIMRMLALKAVLLGTLATPILPISALCQQEVDPTNYPLTNATIADAAKAKGAVRGKHSAIANTSKARAAKKQTEKQSLVASNRLKKTSQN